MARMKRRWSPRESTLEDIELSLSGRQSGRKSIGVLNSRKFLHTGVSNRLESLSQLWHVTCPTTNH